MAFRRNRSNGLDLSGVGRSSNKLSGGLFRGRSGAPSSKGSSLGNTGNNPNIMSKSNFRGAMVGRPRQRVSVRAVTIGLAVAVLAVALAAFVGYMVYQQTVRNAIKPDIDEAALAAVLSPAENAEAARWELLVGTEPATVEESRGTITQLALASADPGNKSLSVLWIPVNTRVYIDGYGYRQVGQIFEIGNEADLCTVVGRLANVEVSHYLEANRNGLQRLFEQLGIGPDEATVDNAQGAITAVGRKLFGSSAEQLVTRTASVTANVATDMDDEAAVAEFSLLQGMDTETEMYFEQMPSTAEEHDGVVYSVPEVGGWTTMVTRVASGMSPVASSQELGNYAQLRADNVVDIWNGVGVNGVAKDCSDELKKHGWTIAVTGNAAQFVYEETLVIYKDNADEEAARLLVADLGQGRVVRSAFRYEYSGDILVVVGKNYQPH